MNSSFNKEIQLSDVNIKNRDINTERSNNKTKNKTNNIIKTLKKYKRYYKRKIPNKKKLFESIAYNNLIKKYNYNQEKYNLLCINNILTNTYCHLVSEFKEKMLTDYINEFFKRKYNMKEIKERIPKFYLYYKHYSIFFGQPFFKNFALYKLIQKNGEKKARIYYKNHYQNGESKDEGNENLGFAQSETDNDNISTKYKNNNIKKNISHIFDSSIKENIDNVTLMTTINSFQNNTINLKLNNEKIEIFSENKADKSNDTTLGEIINYINNKDLDAKKEKNKATKKKNHSIKENLHNLLNKNDKKIYINENNKKKIFELINTNNSKIKKKIKLSSIKKNFIKNQNINTNTLTQRNINTYTQRNKTNSKSKSKINEEKNKKKIMPNKNLNSNRIYKKVKLLSFEEEDMNNLINSNMIKSSRYKNININNNIKNNNKNGIMNSNCTTNKYINNIKISKTLKNITDRNIKRNTISSKKEKKKLEINDLTESKIIKDKKKKKILTRNYISPLNNKYTYNTKVHINHINKLNNNNKISLNNLSYQTLNFGKGLTHQRTYSNNVENPLIFSKCLITDRYKVYNKPFIRINKNEKIKKEISDIKNELKTSIHENYNSLIHQKHSFKNFNDLKNKEPNKKRINLNNYDKKSNFSKYIMDVIKAGNSKNNLNNRNKLNNNKDLIHIALSLMNNQNNLKKNYNLNININNEININENNNINNSTYSINNLTQRINNKNINNKNVINLKKNKNNNTKETINSYRSNYPFSKKKIKLNNTNINKKDVKKIRKRNYEKNINEALTSINNNFVNSIYITNSLENNNSKNTNNKININKSKNLKKFHTKSISSLIDLMNHNKRFISFYSNLNKSK